MNDRIEIGDLVTINAAVESQHRPDDPACTPDYTAVYRVADTDYDRAMVYPVEGGRGWIVSYDALTLAVRS